MYGNHIPLTIRSADLNGDLLVNLSDVVDFTRSLHTFDTRCDFNNDGDISLSDIAKFTGSIGVTCP